MSDTAKGGRVRTADKLALFARFLEGFEENEAATLHFLHLMLPHLPWRYLPSGHEYGPLQEGIYPHGVGDHYLGPARLGLDPSEMARRLGVSELSDMGFRFELPAEAAAEKSALSLHLSAVSPRKVACEISIVAKASGEPEIEGWAIEYTEPKGAEGAL